MSGDALPSAARGSAAEHLASHYSSQIYGPKEAGMGRNRRTQRHLHKVPHRRPKEADLCNPTPGCNKVQALELIKYEELWVHQHFDPFSSFL